MKPIKGYDGYFITEDGKIFSKKTNRYLKQGVRNKGKGYCLVTFSLGYGRKNTKSFYVHRLVAECFIANPYNKTQVNHKDGNKSNNHYSNLEWCTQIENIIHGTQKLGTQYGPYECSQYDLNNNLIAVYPTMNDAHKKIGANEGALRKVRQGLLKKHLNSYWTFKQVV